MVHLDATVAHKEAGDKGLKGGALGFVSSVVVGVASTAPAYSLAATLGFVVIAINGLQAPIITILAFVPMLFISYGYKALNYADPDCGTTFTWGPGPSGLRRAGGRLGDRRADILVMASLAQVAGSTSSSSSVRDGISSNPTSGWVLLVGVGWIVAMTAICYMGSRSRRTCRRSCWGSRSRSSSCSRSSRWRRWAWPRPPGHLTPSVVVVQPLPPSPNPESFMVGFTLMLFIYWGWDTAVSVNEETKDSRQDAGHGGRDLYADPAGDLRTGGHGIAVLRRDRNPRHRPRQQRQQNDVINVLGTSVFGTSGIGMVHDEAAAPHGPLSAAASTQTTILPTARTTLSMATFKAIPSAFARIHRRFLTPTVSTVAWALSRSCSTW